MRAEYSSPALEDWDRNAIHAARFDRISAHQGTPRLSTMENMRGALPVRAMKRMVREATYREELPAEMTEMTISALMRCAAGRTPAESRAIVSGERAVREVEERRRESVYGIRIPMKNIIPLEV